MNPLDIVLLLPLIGFFFVLFMPKGMDRIVALGASVITFLASLQLIGPFMAGHRDWQFITDITWVATPHIQYHVALDGINIWLVLLSTLLTPLAMLISWNTVTDRTRQFYACLLFLEFSLIGVFSSLDIFLFYIFFELTLVPMIFLIGIYGGERRVYAAGKFFLYTLAGSVFLLGALIYLYTRSGGNTFDLVQLTTLIQSGKLALGRQEGLVLFLGFFIAFAVKLALFPVHTWLPDAYTEAPTAGTFMLAAVMTKMGTYGLIRFCVPLFPSAAHQCASWIIILGIIGIIYGALIALVQPNLKRLVAYSSISHIGFIVVGIFSFTQNGMDGAVYQMLCHGISTGALFLLVGMIESRRGSSDMAQLGGIATPAPKLAVMFAIAMLASIGLPTLCNFIGEYLILQGIAQAQFRFAVFAAIGVILSACYMLWAYQRTFLGRAHQAETAALPDLSFRELGVLAPLVLLMVWMGIGTQTFLPSIGIANSALLKQAEIGVEYQSKAQPAVQETARVR